MRTFRSIIQEHEQEKEDNRFSEELANWLNEFQEPEFVFKTFREYLRESPQWNNTDCNFGQETLQKMMGNEDFLDEFRWSAIQDHRTLVNKGDRRANKFIIQTNDLSKAFLGHCDDGMFKILSELTHMQPKTYKGIGTVTEIKTVNTHSKFRNNGFAAAIYKSVLYEGTVLMSDALQYKGAVKIWKSFVNTEEGKEWQSMIDDKKIKVSLYDKLKSKVIYDDITGMKDEDIWSSDASKSEYRLVAEWK